ncbi:hypothetical protein RZO95_24920 [Klebsiella variicola subsp. variicola]|uniref:hypothetical protein n=1 Tax=Klebsiella variicola TaxID=244366 RepID=UPI00292A9CA9|nr:hypothetical protein [Klebsiella variicola]MDV0625193.1 hypothetical protein [Klebsiella variicola subsp. variicola]
MQSNEQEVFSLIEQRILTLKSPYIIGISGAYTSGKTTFSGKLMQYLQSQGSKVQLIHYDDFHYPFSAIHWGDEKDDEIYTFYKNAFDDSKLIREILLPIKNKGLLKKNVSCINLGSGQYSNDIRFDVDEKTIVIIEGVLLFRQPLLKFLDYKIFLDISADEMLNRGTIRDVPKFGENIIHLYRSRYIPVHHRHMEEDKPKEVSDMVVDNGDYLNPIVLR